MFIALLAVTLVISFVVSLIVASVFDKPISNILGRIVNPDISFAWGRYIKFAILVMGVSSGVRIYQLERYITPNQHVEKSEIIRLTSERWVLEVYRTIIEALQGIAWMLLVFFCIALVAYVVVRIVSLRRSPERTSDL